MSNTCPGCPFVAACDSKAFALQSAVANLEELVARNVSAEVHHALEADRLKQVQPKNWLKRLFVQGDIGLESERSLIAHEDAKDYHAYQQLQQKNIAELNRLVTEAPKTCAQPTTRLGRLVCTSELNDRKNRRKL